MRLDDTPEMSQRLLNTCYLFNPISLFYSTIAKIYSHQPNYISQLHMIFFFFLNDPATPEIYPLPLPAPLPIYRTKGGWPSPSGTVAQRPGLGLPHSRQALSLSVRSVRNSRPCHTSRHRPTLSKVAAPRDVRQIGRAHV